MKNKAYIFIKRLLLVVLIVAMIPLWSEEYKAISEDDVKKAEQNLEAAKKRDEELKKQLSQLQGSISSTQEYIGKLDGIISDTTYRIYLLGQDITNKQAEIDAKQMEIDTTLAGIAYVRDEIDRTRQNLIDAQDREAQQFAAMKLRIQYMYENGDESFMELLFSSESMVDFLNNAEYISQISKYDREKLDEYSETKAEVATYLANLEGQENELVIQEAKLENDMSELDMQMSVLNNMMAELEVQQQTNNNLMSVKQDELNKLQNEQSYTEEQKKLAEQEVADQKAILDQTRKEYAEWLKKLAEQNQNVDEMVAAKLAEINITGFTWPLPGYNRITSPFGMRMHPILGYMKLHDGTDIAGANVYGKPIVAAYSGTVVLSQSYWGYGECVKIDHGGGIQTLYAHASVRLVSVGQYVNAGDTIALVGDTGNSTAPHLHFSLIIKGEFVNPLDYVVVPKY